MSAAAGPRLTWGPFAFQGGLDLAIVGWGGSQGTYKWSWFLIGDRFLQLHFGITLG